MRDHAETLIDWIDTVDALPLFLSGLPLEAAKPEETPAVFGVATGRAETELAAAITE